MGWPSSAPSSKAPTAASWSNPTATPGSVRPWSVRLHGLGADELAALEATLEACDQLLVPAAAEPEPPVCEPWSLMVRVLGPVDVVDRALVEQPHSTGEGPGAGRLAGTARDPRPPGPELGPPCGTWTSRTPRSPTSSRKARRALARLVPTPEGEEWLARTYAERLPLHRAIVLDADLVRAHLARARAATGERAIEELRQAARAGARRALCGPVLPVAGRRGAPLDAHPAGDDAWPPSWAGACWRRATPRESSRPLRSGSTSSPATRSSLACGCRHTRSRRPVGAASGVRLLRAGCPGRPLGWRAVTRAGRTPARAAGSGSRGRRLTVSGG